MGDFVVGRITFPPVVNGGYTDHPPSWKGNIEEVEALCRRLTEAAKKLGPTDEGIACIEAQDKLMEMFRNRVFGMAYF